MLKYFEIFKIFVNFSTFRNYYCFLFIQHYRKVQNFSKWRSIVKFPEEFLWDGRKTWKMENFGKWKVINLVFWVFKRWNPSKTFVTKSTCGNTNFKANWKKKKTVFWEIHIWKFLLVFSIFRLFLRVFRKNGGRFGFSGK